MEMAKMENDEMKNGKLIPRLRFPGFEGKWEEKKLGEVATFKRGMTITAKDTKNGDVPVIAGGQTPSCYHNVSNREGETIAISGSGAYAGFVSFWNTPVFLSDSFSVETEIDIDKKYAFYYLKHKQQDLFFMQKGAGVPHVHGTDVGNLIIPLPSLPEQQKIASCLSELDNLIAAQGQKVDALKEKKKGLMQQLFPQPGETTPRMRFSGFEEEWKAKKLGEMITEVKDTTTGSINIPLYSLTIEEGVTVKTDRYERGFLVTKKENLFKIVSPNDFVSNPMNLRFGAIDYNKNDFCVCVSGYYDVFRFKEGGTTVFWSNYLKSDLMLHVYDVIAIGSLLEKRRVYFSTLQNLELLVPTLPEQQKIASCLSSLDDLIAAESAKVEALKDHKKGLMQQLFPQPAK